MPEKGIHALCGKKLWAKVAQKLFEPVQGISGKNPSHPHKFASLTPMDFIVGLQQRQAMAARKTKLNNFKSRKGLQK